MNRVVVISTCWLTMLVGCSLPESPRLQDIEGTMHTPLRDPKTTTQVFVVTSHECPIAKAYAPVLAELALSWQDQDVELFIIQADPDLSADAAKKHAQEYDLPGIVLLDPYHSLIKALGATRTPEAIVRRDGKIVYCGRIDDQWHALGARAQEASTFDLRDAVTATLANKPVAVAKTSVIGCLLPEPK